jgi:hypothetical protein
VGFTGGGEDYCRSGDDPKAWRIATAVLARMRFGSSMR